MLKSYLSVVLRIDKLAVFAMQPALRGDLF